ncbi:MAG: hypothetical protein ED557_10540 [Balneola sp.]|nr:MAG: hypothetical protein ED557_10540 [Balneola sp.]
MEFRISPGWRIFIYALCLLFGGLGIALLYNVLFDRVSEDIWVLVLLFMLGLIAFSFSTYALIRTYREVLIVKKDLFFHQVAFKSHSMFLAEIQGFEIDENYFRIIPKSKNQKPLKVTRYLEDSISLINFLSQNFDELSLYKLTREANEIVADERFGRNNFERNERFELAKKTTKWLNGTSFILLILALFFPSPYDLVILFNMIIPFVAIFLIIQFKGLLKINDRANTIYPSLFVSLLFPTCALGMRVLYDFNFITTKWIWVFSIPLSLCIVLILFFKTDEVGFSKKSDFGATYMFPFFLYGFFCSAIAISNVIFDTSSAVRYQAEIIQKKQSDNFNNLVLSENWHPLNTKKTEGKVSLSFYNRVKIGDIVTVEVKKGAYGIPWFQVLEDSFKPTGKRNYGLTLPDSLSL